MNMLLAAIEVLICIESGGDWRAIGDKGASAGCLQIQEAVVVDVNSILGYQKYTQADRFNCEKSKEMAKIYLTHYCSMARLGHEPTIEDFVKCWNGGPSFYKTRNVKKLARLERHWHKAQRLLGDEYGLAYLRSKGYLPKI